MCSSCSCSFISTCSLVLTLLALLPSALHLLLRQPTAKTFKLALVGHAHTTPHTPSTAYAPTGRWWPWVHVLQALGNGGVVCIV